MTRNERIRVLRKSLNLTQKEFGAKLNRRQDNISYIELGKGVARPGLIKRISIEYGVSYEWLMYGEGEIGQIHL